MQIRAQSAMNGASKNEIATLIYFELVEKYVISIFLGCARNERLVSWSFFGSIFFFAIEYFAQQDKERRHQDELFF